MDSRLPRTTEHHQQILNGCWTRPTSRSGWLQSRVVVGTAPVASEGGFEPEMGELINGERRPPGHLLPEALAVAVSKGTDVESRGIVRIATHPKLRRQGVAPVF